MEAIPKPRRRPARRRRRKLTYAVWPPPHLNLPSAEILEALSRVDLADPVPDVQQELNLGPPLQEAKADTVSALVADRGG